MSSPDLPKKWAAPKPRTDVLKVRVRHGFVQKKAGRSGPVLRLTTVGERGPETFVTKKDPT